jgi:AcrR family transcriptional regulator
MEATMPVRTGTRQLILEAAVTCIERDGLEGVTTRKIAQEAGTNIASINYYFRSKDELLAKVLEMTIRHMLEDVLTAIEDREQSFEATLRSVIFYLFDGSLRFPGISRAHLQQATSGSKNGSISARVMRRVFERMVQRATSTFPRTDPSLIRLRLSQVLSAILFAMLAPELFSIPRRFRPVTTKNAEILADSYTALFLGSIDVA